MKVRDVISLLERDGWRLPRTLGSRRQYGHSVKNGLVADLLAHDVQASGQTGDT